MAQVTNVENICSVQTYTNKNGETKNVFHQVGKITHFDNGGQSMELFMFPGVRFTVLPQTQPK